MIWLVNNSIFFYPITSQRKFSNHKTKLCEVRTQWCYIFSSDITSTNHFVRTYFWWFHTRAPHTSPLVCVPPQLTLSPSHTTCTVDDFQHLIFVNIQSPKKFTGNPTIVSHPKTSRESLKHRPIFTFTLHTIYPSTRSMARDSYKSVHQRRVSTCHW